MNKRNKAIVAVCLVACMAMGAAMLAGCKGEELAVSGDWQLRFMDG